MCIRVCIFKFKKTKPKITRRQKAKETKEETRTSVKNLSGYDDIGISGYDDIVCKFALCSLNLFYQVVNFSWFFLWIQCGICRKREIAIFVILQQHMSKGNPLIDTFVDHFLFYFKGYRVSISYFDQILGKREC